MPVYEFYCADCHTIFNFLARRVNTTASPACPRCGRPGLDRRVSRFAITRNRPDEPLDGMPDLDDEQLERAMRSLAGDMEGLNEDDPRQVARFMRKLQEATGMNLGPAFDEAMRRLEAGEDPEALEEEMGDLFDAENPFSSEGIKGLKRRLSPPEHDDTLHRLPVGDEEAGIP